MKQWRKWCKNKIQILSFLLQISISFFYRSFCGSSFFNSETAKQRNSETAKQRNSETAKQRNSETAKQRNSETANKGGLYLNKDSHKKFGNFLLCVCFIFQFSINCRTFYAPSSNDGIFKDGWFSKPQASVNNFDGTRRAAYFFDIRDGEIPLYCAEPAPDTGLNTQFEVLVEQLSKMQAANIASTEVKNSGKVNNGETIKELGGRTQAILFLREAFYRLCEMNVNFYNLNRSQGDPKAKSGMSPDIYHDLYKKILITSLLISQSDYAKPENIGILQQFMFSKESGGIDNLTTLINKTNESQRALIEASIRKLEAEAKKTDSETEKAKADTELEKQKQQTLKLQQGQSSVSPNSPSGSNANQITVVVPETNCENQSVPKTGTNYKKPQKSCK